MEKMTYAAWKTHMSSLHNALGVSVWVTEWRWEIHNLPGITDIVIGFMFPVRYAPLRRLSVYNWDSVYFEIRAEAEDTPDHRIRNTT
jgi:hypothetical protein